MRPKSADGALDAAPPTDVGLLRVEELSTHFKTRDGVIRAVDGVSFSLDEGETYVAVSDRVPGAYELSKYIAEQMNNPFTDLLPDPPEDEEAEESETAAEPEAQAETAATDVFESTDQDTDSEADEEPAAESEDG